LDIRHPDIEDFILSKTSKASQVFMKDEITGRVKDISHANISVKMTDEFMNAVNDNKTWDLVFPDIEKVGVETYTKEWKGDYKEWKNKGYPLKIYKTVQAKDLYYKLCSSVWECGDPGVLFLDTAQRWTPISDFPELLPKGTNP
jgi:ribonucleoside-diphosphate reductase alpha chain